MAVRVNKREAEMPGRPTWAAVDTAAITDNYRALAALLHRPARLIPVVKADAYGHGAAAVARALEHAGATAVAVAIVEEGVALREGGCGVEILVLEGAWPRQEETALRHRLTLAIHSTDGIGRLGAAARRAGVEAVVHLKIDTGMARLGARWDALAPVLESLAAAKNLVLRGAFSHLAAADEEDSGFTRAQTERFRAAVDQIRAASLDPGELHLAASAGLIHHPELRAWSARPGIALYGYPPAPERCPLSLRPALELHSTIVRLARLEPGDSVGYNRRFVAARATRAATLPIGYADGYRRDLTGKGLALVRGRTAPVIGAVSMDMIVIDVTEIAEAQEGNDVLLLGSTASCRFDAADWAAAAGTIPYEVLCGIGRRVPRLERRAAD